MQNLVILITPLEWVLLGIVLVSLVITCVSWCRMSRVLQVIDKTPTTEETAHDELPMVEEPEQRPDVSLDLSAYKNELGLVTLKLVNSGMLASRKIDLTIDDPENIFDAESMIDGSESATLLDNSVISPRLSVLDSENTLPISEIHSGKTLELPAALTMSHGKVCEFPTSLKWIDENGAMQQKRVKLTV